MDRFTQPIPIDPDLPIYKHNFVQAVAKNIRNKVGIDKWVVIASVTKMTLNEYLDLDEFWQEAVFEAVQDMLTEQQKEQNKTLDSMTSKLEEMRPYSSGMASLPKPNFVMP